MKRFALALTTNQVDFAEIPVRNLDMANMEESMRQIMVDHRDAARSTFVSQWIRTQPDPVDNIFGAITYFVVPKSFLQQGMRMSLMVKDEQEPSLVSFPTEVVG